MRRPSIACPRAAPSLSGAPPDHVWISDHLLSAAVSRFFRISCPHQKRHGSNVPGPLEARRRAAKRRMTLQANFEPSAGLSTPLFSLASLFGHRRPGEPHWTYEPPSLRKAELSDFASNISCRPPPDAPIPISAYGFHQPPDEISRTPPRSSFPYDSTLDTSLKLEQAVSTETTTPEQHVGYTQSFDRSTRPHVEAEHAAFPDKNDSRSDTSSSREASVQLKTVTGRSVDREDLNACFGRFCELIDAAPLDIKEQPQSFLHKVFRDCCPDFLLTEDLDSRRAEHFGVLAYQYLREHQWPVESIYGCLSDPTVRLPNIFSPQGLLFLQQLDADDLAVTNDRSAKISLFKRFVSQLRDQSYTRSRASACNQHDRYASLRLLIRGLWHAAFGSGCSLDLRAAASLRAAALAMEDSDLSNLLCKFWDNSSAPTDALHNLHGLIDDCAEGRVPIPLALQVLECIPSALLRGWAASMPSTFSKLDNTQIGRSSDRLVLHLETWFHLLWRLDMRHNAGLSSESSIYQEVFSSFAEKFFSDTYPPRTLVTALMYRLAAHVSLDGNEELHEFFISHRPSLVAQHKDGKSLIDMLASLTSALAEKDLPNHGVLELITPYLDEHKSFYSVSKLLERIRKRQTTISCPVFLDEYTRRVLEEVQNVPCPTRRARDLAGHERLLAARRALCISTAAQDAVITQSRARRNFEHILERANAARIMPLAYRKVTANITRDAQTDLIHQLASQYAMERTRGWQQNYRSLRYLYIYLTTYNLPIREAFSRAVVEICISRPLSENRHIAQERATWVCRLVARVEGVHRARLIWHIFWARRGDLILSSKTKLIQMGLHDRAHVNTMRMLKLLPEHPGK